ncbi:MAG: hypothetical protein ACHP7N_14860 [Caulobacterales bacterium]
MKAKSSGKTAPFQVSTDGLETIAAAIGQAAERSQSLLSAGLKTWESEASRYFEDIAAQGQATLAALGKCATPLEVLAVEQEWVKARSQAYLESGMRLAQAFASVAQGVTAADEPGPSPEPETSAPAAPSAGA